MQELKELLRTYLAEETADKLADIISKDTPILIDGKQGPTGKTTLCRKLKALGYDAQEQWKAKKSEEHDNGFKVVIFLNKFVSPELVSPKELLEKTIPDFLQSRKEKSHES